MLYRTLTNLTPNLRYNQLNFRGKKDVAAFMDYDGTYKDHQHPETRNVLETGLVDLRSQYAKSDINFIPILISARPKERLQEEHPSDVIQWCISQNGGEITKGSPSTNTKNYEKWEALNASTGFKAKKVQDAVNRISKLPEFSSFKILPVGDVVNNPQASACEYMQPFCIALDNIKLAKDEPKEILTEKNYKTPKQVKRFIRIVSKDLKKQGIKFEINQPYLYKDKPYIMFDIASPYANKGQAIKFLLKELDIKRKNVIVAGDGGNDIAMMKTLKGHSKGDGRSLIVVGENKTLINNAKSLYKDELVIRPPEESSSIGVLEGLKIHLARITDRILGKTIKKTKTNILA